ncbi:MAG TPA: hypothetical protein VFQ06_08780 [Nitrospira sp.]|nr:hypothetical protein [Nitrospira sp.]
MVLCFQRATDIAVGAGSAQEHVRDRAHEQAVQRGRLSGEDVGQGGQMQVVVDRLQRGAPFRVR